MRQGLLDLFHQVVQFEGFVDDRGTELRRSSMDLFVSEGGDEDSDDPGVSLPAPDEEGEAVLAGKVHAVREVAATEFLDGLREVWVAGFSGDPAVVVDGEVKSVGKIPSKQEINSWIQ